MGNFATHSIKRAADVMGLEVRRRSDRKPWDQSFRNWITEAEARGMDPNDLVNVKWAGDPARVLEMHAADL